MFWIFIAAFIIAAAAHFVFLFFEKKIPQALTKICLLPLLAGVYVLGAKYFFVPVILALFFGWGGDIFLLKIREIKFFRMGLASFLLGHLCYIFSFIFFAGTVNIMILVISLVGAIPLGFAVHSIIRPKKEMNLPAIVYEIIIMLMSLSALQLLFARRDRYGLLIFAGSLCFLFSDTFLAYCTFRTRPKYAGFVVMLSYIAAQSGIVLGLIGIA
jgi:uncharacterized membrane protein YhhN